MTIIVIDESKFLITIFATPLHRLNHISCPCLFPGEELMDGNRLFADKGKYLGKKYGKFRVRKEIRSWMIGQGLTINSGKFSVVVVQEVYPASGKQTCNADVQAV